VKPTHFVIGIALVFSTTGLHASEEANGRALLRKCTMALKIIDARPSANNQRPADAMVALDGGVCLGLVTGVMDTMAAWNVAEPHQDVSVHGCVPWGLEPGKATRIVVKYLQDNPENLDQRHSLLILMALLKEFPCKTASR
jgi:hypothetical protein